MVHTGKKHSKKSPQQTNPIGRQLETGPDGKLSPAEAEAIMSTDLPSGDPELSAPASSPEQRRDFKRNKRIKKAA